MATEIRPDDILPAGPPQTSGKAVASMVLGILSFCFCLFTGIPGLVLGIMGLSDVNRSGGALQGRGMAIAGIVTSSIGGLLFMPALIALLLPAVNGAREAARQAACRNNMRQIGLALMMYYDTHNAYPPAVTYDDQGQPMHSWRALLLPFLDESRAGEYRLDEPWNGPNNSKLAKRMPSQLTCPSYEASERENAQPGTTVYLAAVGEHTALRNGISVPMRDIGNRSMAIMVVEASESPVNWLEPRDFDVETMSLVEDDPQRPLSQHPHPMGRNVLKADGSVDFLPDNMNRGEVNQMLSIEGPGEVPAGP